MTTNKRYRLLKDLPQCKAGTIFDKYDETAIDYVALGVTQWDSGKCKHVEVFLLDCHVENNPEWFSEILPEEKSFNKYRGNLKDDHGRIIFEISECGRYIVEEYRGEEKVLPRTESPSTQSSRDWEIVELWNGKGVWFHEGGPGEDWTKLLKDPTLQISQVRRLSDGEIFTIGDEINVTGKGVKIRAFEISATGRNIEVQFDYGNSLHYQWLYQIQKSPSPSTSIPEDKKPPLGIMPEWRWKELRLQDVQGAIDRYLEVDKPIPTDFIEEKYQLQTWLNKRKQSPPIPQDGKLTVPEYIAKGMRESNLCKENEQKTERIEVTEIKAEGFSDHGNWYRFHIARSPGKEWPTVLKAQVPAIKSAIEWVINEDEGKPGEISVWAAIKVLEQSDWLCMKRILSAAKQRS